MSNTSWPLNGKQCLDAIHNGDDHLYMPSKSTLHKRQRSAEPLSVHALGCTSNEDVLMIDTPTEPVDVRDVEYDVCLGMVR